MTTFTHTHACTHTHTHTLSLTYSLKQHYSCESQHRKQSASYWTSHFLFPGANVEYNHQIIKVEQGAEAGSLTVTDTSGASASFQAVVLTMPVPQILQLKGVIQKSLGECGGFSDTDVNTAFIIIQTLAEHLVLS